MKDAQACDDELLRKLDSAASPEVSGMLNRYFVAALCESAAARLRFKDAAIDNLAAEVERLRVERRWIPVEERLPKKDGYYLTYRPGCAPEDRTVSLYFFATEGTWEGSYFVASGLNCPTLKVTHWQPLPAPPEKEE